MRSGRNFGSFDSQYTPFKQKKPHSIIFTLSWVLVYITFAHGRTDSFWKGFICSFWSRIHIHVYTYVSRLFLKFHPPVTKVSIPVLHIGNRYENSKFLRIQILRIKISFELLKKDICKFLSYLFQKQVRTNIGLADTLIPSSCDSFKIIYGNDVYS